MFRWVAGTLILGATVANVITLPIYIISINRQQAKMEQVYPKLVSHIIVTRIRVLAIIRLAKFRDQATA